MRRRAILFMPDYPDEKRAKTVDAAAFFKDAKLGINRTEFYSDRTNDCERFAQSKDKIRITAVKITPPVYITRA